MNDNDINTNMNTASSDRQPQLSEFLACQALYGRAAGLVSLVCISVMLFATGVFIIVKSSGSKGYPAILGMVCLIFFALAVYAVRKSFLNYIELKTKLREGTPEDVLTDAALRAPVHTADELRADILRYGAAALFFCSLSVLAFIRILDTYGIFWVLLFIAAASVAIVLIAAVITFIRLLSLSKQLEI